MRKSCIHFRAVTNFSEKHNNRIINPKHFIVSDVPNIHIVHDTIVNKHKEIKEKYFETVGRKMQCIAKPIREAIIVLPDNNNDRNLQNLFLLNEQLNERYGIEAFQIHIHNDEGFIDEYNIPQYYYHAHVVYNWNDKNTGKSSRLRKEDLSEIQTLTAECLEMERGVKKSNSFNLEHQEYKEYIEFKLIKDKLLKEYKEQKYTKESRINIFQH